MRSSTLLLCVIAVCTLLPATAARATDYIIEIVLFENLFRSDSVHTPALYVPRINDAFSLGAGQASSAGFTIVEEDLSLLANADSLKQARSYRVMEHFAWRQPGLDDESAKPIRIDTGDSFRVFIPGDYQIYPDFIPAMASAAGESAEREITTTTLSGTLTVRLGRFLHLDTKLVFTDTDTATSYRMSHSRKMRSRELHYIDNPKFGMLVKILPVPE